MGTKFDEPVSTIAERLKEALEARHMTAADLSRATKITTASLSHYMNGRYVPKQDKIHILSQALNVSPTWLMGFNVDMEGNERKVPHGKKLPVHHYIEHSEYGGFDYREFLEFVKYSVEKELQETNNITDSKKPLGNLFQKQPETTQIPIIANVKCGYNGLAYEYQEGSVFIDDNSYHGDIKAFRCYGDSMTGIGIYDGDIALVRIQDDIESGELAIVIIDGEEGVLKRVRKQEGAIILESANPSCPPRVFTGEDMNNVRIVGKVVEIRRKF